MGILRQEVSARRFPAQIRLTLDLRYLGIHADKQIVIVVGLGHLVLALVAFSTFLNHALHRRKALSSEAS